MSFLTTNKAILILLVHILTAVTIVAQDQVSSPAAQEADELFRAHKWGEAAKVYEQIVKADPSNGRAWYRLGMSLHLMGRYNRAVEAYEKAAAIANNPAVMYNLACSHAKLNNKDKAFEWLDKALNAGFPQGSLLNTDGDLASLRDDARFQRILALAAKLLTPCEVLPEYKQFDFWVGEWDVMTPQGQLAGTNSVQRIVDGCVIFENWTGAMGGTGKSFNFYNANTRKWQQTWVSSTGNVLELTGEYKNGAMRYEGITVAKDGAKTLEKLTFFNLSPDRVRQFWEQSTDGGKTWKVVFDGMYIRKKGAAGAGSK